MELMKPAPNQNSELNIPTKRITMGLTVASVLIIAFAQLAAAGGNEAGIAYLEENTKKEGVITLPSGLQYKVLTKGGGDSHPTADSSCSCHYAGIVSEGTNE